MKKQENDVHAFKVQINLRICFPESAYVSFLIFYVVCVLIKLKGLAVCMGINKILHINADIFHLFFCNRIAIWNPVNNAV